MSELKNEVKQYYELLTIDNDLSSPIIFFDVDSDKNLPKKLNILKKMFHGDDLTNEERFDKTIFEKLPENANKMILN